MERRPARQSGRCRARRYRLGRVLCDTLWVAAWVAMGLTGTGQCADVAASEHALMPLTQTLDPATLDGLLAPLALYPDDVLAQVLTAATYPLDIADARRWVEDRAGWAPEALEAQAALLPWDASVKALLPFADLLALLDQNIGWTEELGEAFLAQQADVAESIQRLRHEASAMQTLYSTPEQQVTEDGSDIVITPTNTDVIYVPVYSPDAIYGQTSNAALAPVLLVGPPGGMWVGEIYWCAPVPGANWLWGRWNWRLHRVEINLPHFNAYNPHRLSPVWGFVLAQRRGIPFRMTVLNARYSGAPSNANPGGAIDSQTSRLLNSLSWQPPALVAPGVAPPAASALPNGALQVPRIQRATPLPERSRPPENAVHSERENATKPVPVTTHGVSGSSQNPAEMQH